MPKKPKGYTPTVNNINDRLDNEGGLDLASASLVSSCYQEMIQYKVSFKEVLDKQGVKVATEEEAKQAFRNIVVERFRDELSQNQSRSPSISVAKYQLAEITIKESGIKYSEIFVMSSEKEAIQHFSKLVKQATVDEALEYANQAIRHDPGSDYKAINQSSPYTKLYDAKSLQDGSAWVMEKSITVKNIAIMKYKMKEHGLSYEDLFGKNASKYKEYFENNLDYMKQAQECANHYQNKGIITQLKTDILKRPQLKTVMNKELSTIIDFEKTVVSLTLNCQMHQQQQGKRELFNGLLSEDTMRILSKMPILQIFMNSEPQEPRLPPDDGIGLNSRPASSKKV